MYSKEKLLNNLNKILRKDKYINALLYSSGIEIDTLESVLEDIYNQYWFDTMTWGVDILARKMDMNFREDQTIEEKRSKIRSKWISKGKIDAEKLQAICDSWKNGEIEVDYNESVIKLKFVGCAGVPTDLKSLKSEINKAKPAYLLVDYLFKYLLIKEIHNVMTISQIQTITLDKFAGGEV